MKPITKPVPGDVLHIDVSEGQPTGIWHQRGGVYSDITGDVLADVSQPDHVVLRGKQQPNIYTAPQDWECVANDEGESSPDMRRAVVSGWAI